MADLTQAFAPGNASDDLGKTDFFDFVVSPPPHSGGISDDESYLHRTTCRGLSYLQDPHPHNNNHHHHHHHHNNHHHHDDHDIHTSSSFIKETNNNTLTALPPVSTITGSLNHHHHAVRNHCVQTNDQIPMDQSDCDYWGTDDSKEQTCNILLEDLNKYCWTTSTTNQNDVHGGNNDHTINHISTTTATTTTSSSSSSCDRQNTDGAIYTLTVLNNEGNSMDGLDCCKSPTAPSSDSWSLRPSIDLDAILNLEQSPNEQDPHDVQNQTDVNCVSERYHIIQTPSSQYADDSGFVESKELCRQNNNNNSNNSKNNNNNINNNSNSNSSNNNNNNESNNNNNNKTKLIVTTTGDNNNDWKLTDQNHLQDTIVATTTAAATAVTINDSAESLLRSALQGKLYSAAAQIVSSSPSSNQPSTISLSVTGPNNTLQIIEHQQSSQSQDSQQNDTLCTEDDFLLSQLDTTTYRPDDYEKLKRIANEVVESYCNLEPVCNVTGTTTVMYTLDPTSGSLGTITLPADLGQVGTVTVVAAQPDIIQQVTPTRSDESQQQQQATNSQITPARPAITTTTTTTNSGTKTAKKYCRRSNKNSGNNGSNGTASGAGGNNGNANQTGGGGGGGSAGNGNSNSSSASAQRKERSLHYCSICSKGFKDKYSVNVHIRTHTGEKPFACSLCGKSFRQKAHLAKHHQTHNAQKPSVSNGGNNSSPSESSAASTGAGTTELAVCNQSS